MSPSQLPYGRSPYGLVSPTDACTRGLQRMPAPPTLMSELVGMAGYGPSYLDFMDDDIGSDDSSIGDVAPSHCSSRECAMTDALEQPPGITESARTHAPPGPHAETPELTCEHGEELRQRWLHQPPTALARSAHHAVPRAHKSASDARGHARQVQRNIMDGGNDPPQFARASQNIAVAAMLLRSLSEPNDPREQAIHRNLRALVETAAVQQAESSISQGRLAPSLPTRGIGTQQMGRPTRSPR